LIAREGWPFVGAGVGLTAALWWGSYSIPFLVWPVGLSVILTAFMLYFFRDPQRQVPQSDEDGLIVSAADGKVVGITPIEHEEYEEYLGQAVVQLSIFLSPFDVHINRTPFAGTVDFVKWHRGRYLAAFVAAASTENEQSIIGIDCGAGRIIVKQIVGVVARRIVCYLKQGDRVGRGDRFGLIRFGSRVDLILPQSTELRVKVGDRVWGGETIIGVIK
jgi:phosphatidylserine decarboxylase